MKKEGNFLCGPEINIANDDLTLGELNSISLWRPQKKLKETGYGWIKWIWVGCKHTLGVE